MKHSNAAGGARWGWLAGKPATLRGGRAQAGCYTSSYGTLTGGSRRSWARFSGGLAPSVLVLASCCLPPALGVGGGGPATPAGLPWAGRGGG